MIFVDSNIPMYLVGAEHPNKLAARRALERYIAEGVRLVTDVEVLQEILHRYAAINRREAIQPAFDLLHEIVDHVYPVELQDVERAKTLTIDTASLSARDAIHVSIMRRHGVAQILSFDCGFDSLAGIDRLDE